MRRYLLERYRVAKGPVQRNVRRQAMFSTTSGNRAVQIRLASLHALETEAETHQTLCGCEWSRELVAGKKRLRTRRRAVPLSKTSTGIRGDSKPLTGLSIQLPPQTNHCPGERKLPVRQSIQRDPTTRRSVYCFPTSLPVSSTNTTTQQESWL